MRKNGENLTGKERKPTMLATLLDRRDSLIGRIKDLKKPQTGSKGNRKIKQNGQALLEQLEERLKELNEEIANQRERATNEDPAPAASPLVRTNLKERATEAREKVFETILPTDRSKAEITEIKININTLFGELHAALVRQYCLDQYYEHEVRVLRGQTAPVSEEQRLALEEIRQERENVLTAYIQRRKSQLVELCRSISESSATKEGLEAGPAQFFAALQQLIRIRAMLEAGKKNLNEVARLRDEHSKAPQPKKSPIAYKILELNDQRNLLKKELGEIVDLPAEIDGILNLALEDAPEVQALFTTPSPEAIEAYLDQFPALRVPAAQVPAPQPAVSEAPAAPTTEAPTPSSSSAGDAPADAGPEPSEQPQADEAPVGNAVEILASESVPAAPDAQAEEQDQLTPQLIQELLGDQNFLLPSSESFIILPTHDPDNLVRLINRLTTIRDLVPDPDHASESLQSIKSYSLKHAKIPGMAGGIFYEFCESIRYQVEIPLMELRKRFSRSNEVSVQFHSHQFRALRALLQQHIVFLSSFVRTEDPTKAPEDFGSERSEETKGDKAPDTIPNPEEKPIESAKRIPESLPSTPEDTFDSLVTKLRAALEAQLRVELRGTIAQEREGMLTAARAGLAAEISRERAALGEQLDSVRNDVAVAEGELKEAREKTSREKARLAEISKEAAAAEKRLEAANAKLEALRKKFFEE